MEKNQYICNNCESEFVIEEVYSELDVKFCPYCSELIEESDE